jgi:hypothetical protein
MDLDLDIRPLYTEQSIQEEARFKSSYQNILLQVSTQHTPSETNCGTATQIPKVTAFTRVLHCGLYTVPHESYYGPSGMYITNFTCKIPTVQIRFLLYL